MATVYNIELTSHWIRYSEKELAAMIKELLEDTNKNNEITVSKVEIKA